MLRTLGGGHTKFKRTYWSHTPLFHGGMPTTPFETSCTIVSRHITWTVNIVYCSRSSYHEPWHWMHMGFCNRNIFLLRDCLYTQKWKYRQILFKRPIETKVIKIQFLFFCHLHDFRAFRCDFYDLLSNNLYSNRLFI